MTDVAGRIEPTTPRRTTAERRAAGKARREQVPRSSHGDWAPAVDRPDPCDLLAEQERTRWASLIPLRHQRMAASPFTFFRGAARVFAADMADQPRTGLRVQLCGDAHLSNFGTFASPERSLVFDINDFDETLPGPFEWDLKRLAASFEVAARANGFDEPDRVAVQHALVAMYADAMARLAAMSHLDVWYTRVTYGVVDEHWGPAMSKALQARFEATVQKAQSKDRLKAFRKLTTIVDGEPRFLSDPPLLQPADDLLDGADHARLVAVVAKALKGYRHTLQADRRELLERYTFVDLAMKVVGVGSVGTRCWVALLMGQDDQDPLFLQVKEAEASVMESYLGHSGFAQHGQRVVEGQRLMQTASDILLGWDRAEGLDGVDHDYYFRQLWDWKGSADVNGMAPDMLTLYGQLCAFTLARAHARSGDAVELSGYLGTGKVLGDAIARFSSAYADQNEADHRAFVAWARANGTLPTA